MSDTDKPAPQPANTAPRAGQPLDPSQPYQTMADKFDIKQEGTPTPGLTASPGLVKIAGSTAPGLPNGGLINHVMGPGQNPVDPIAAGLDTNYDPKTRQQLRIPTQTGVDGAGLRPSTYASNPGGSQVKQAADNTHETLPTAPEAKDEGLATDDAVKPAEAGPILAKPEGEPNT